MTTPSLSDGGARKGHPKGLYYLAFTETWERFSYYGMTALLVLYMINQLLLPGHIENIVGFATFRNTIEAVTGPLSTQALASQIVGLYTGFVYFTPLLGGLIADRWIGQRAAVTIGAVTMAGGHLAMAFDQSFLLALLLLVVGSGLLKGNISAQVGALYPIEDEARRTRGFGIFSTGINFGAVAGPLLCGWLAQVYGWHVGFGVAAIFMLGGLATYLIGFKHLPARVERRTREQKATAAKLTRVEWRTLVALSVVMGLTVFTSISFGQIGNVFQVWLQDHVKLTAGAFLIPVTWYQSLDSLFSIIAVPVLFAAWRLTARRRGSEPDDLQKITTGAMIGAASNLVLVAAIVLSGDQPIHPLWPVLYCAAQGFSFIHYWPTLLALVSRAAPAQVNATAMGFTFMSLFVAFTLTGWIGGFYEKMTPTQFWLLHAAIPAVGAVLTLLLRGPLRRVIYSSALDQPLRASARVLEVEG